MTIASVFVSTDLPIAIPSLDYVVCSSRCVVSCRKVPTDSHSRQVLDDHSVANAYQYTPAIFKHPPVGGGYERAAAVVELAMRARARAPTATSA